MKQWVKTIMSASSFEPSLLLHYKTFPQEFFKLKLDRSEMTPSSGIIQSTLFKHFSCNLILFLNLKFELSEWL